MSTELRFMQFWSEIILVISNRVFEIKFMISDQIALHSVQLPLLVELLLYNLTDYVFDFVSILTKCLAKTAKIHINVKRLVILCMDYCSKIQTKKC